VNNSFQERKNKVQLQILNDQKYSRSQGRKKKVQLFKYLTTKNIPFPGKKRRCPTFQIFKVSNITPFVCEEKDKVQLFKYIRFQKIFHSFVKKRPFVCDENTRSNFSET